MQINIRQYEASDPIAWDDYVHNHPKGTLYHLSGWKNIIEKTYGHKTYFLLATDPHRHTQTKQSDTTQSSVLSPQSSSVVGLLPLVHMKHFLFGNRLISMPFMDIGGILANDEETEQALLSEALKLAKSLKATEIELRHTEPIKWIGKDNASSPQSSVLSPQSSAVVLSPQSSSVKSHKARMLLKLPESSEVLLKSFKSKLRSQIKKPMKERLTVQTGGLELLDDFYEVFLVNMRDLGSPVHSKHMIKSVLSEFSEISKILLVHKENKPLAGSVVVGFNKTLHNPWASSLREYARLSPNMLLYWSMLEYAADNGYIHFDFGRSTPDEGTYKFKRQWGSEPNTLFWHYLPLNGSHPVESDESESRFFNKAVHYWQKFPVPVTRILGPMIRKHIGL